MCPEGVCWRPACISRSCDSAALPCCAWTPEAVKWFNRSETTTHRTDCTLPSRFKSVLDFCTVFAPVANRLLCSWPVCPRRKTNSNHSAWTRWPFVDLRCSKKPPVLTLPRVFTAVIGWRHVHNGSRHGNRCNWTP